MDDANRRLAGILAADVVGYSAMVGKDEPGTLARVRSLRTDLIEPLAAEHGGRLFKTTGDGFLAAFASAVQALRCAITIQERLSVEPDGLRLRIGVHQGEVVAEGDDLLGDGVIIAARLEPLAEPGGILISARVREDAAGKMALEVDDLGTPELKNIAVKVQAYRVRLGTVERPALPLPDKPSLVVLPFQNLSGDSEQEYFADGIVEEIITSLSRIRWLFVIARNSAFTYKGRAVDVRQVGRELGVRYVLEGSVRKATGRVRITAQLIQAETRAQIWADRYDGDLQDVFSLQDQITESIIRAIAPTLRQAEIERVRRKRPDNMDAYDLYLRALPHWHAMTQEGNREAMCLLQRALVFDPGYAPALAAQAMLIGYQRVQAWAELTNTRREEMLRVARMAVRCDPNDPEALAGAAHIVAWADAEYDEAMELAERACKLGPNSSFVWSQVGAAQFHAGLWREAATSLERALLLDPVDPMGYTALSHLAHVRINLGDDLGAIEAASRAVRQNANYAFAWRALAAAQALAGRIAEGRKSLEMAMRLAPGWSLAKTRDAAPSRAMSFKRAYGAIAALSEGSGR
jgi:adenylate cyclase